MFPRGGGFGGRDRDEMRRFLTILAVMLVTFAHADPPKIGTVDMRALFERYHGTEEARKQHSLEQARVSRDNNERLARNRELEAELGRVRSQIDDPAVNESRKQQLFKDWQMRQQEALALNREREEFLQRRTRAMNEKMMQRMREILEEIRKMVEEQGREDDYDFVFDRTGLSTSQVPLLLYSKDAVDLTGKLLDRMNRARPSDGGEANGAGNGAGGVLSE